MPKTGFTQRAKGYIVGAGFPCCQTVVAGGTAKGPDDGIAAQFFADLAHRPGTIAQMHTIKPKPFNKAELDSDYVAEQETLMTRGWKRLQELSGISDTLPISEYPLPEFQGR